jgi:malate dehydrogenase (oxaloacetate-decarboxylating)(NADP+)
VPESVLQAAGAESLHFGRDYIIPKPVDPRLLPRVAGAVARAAVACGAARLPAPEYPDPYQPAPHAAGQPVSAT